MAENKNIEVGGRLHSIATGNVLAGADEIFDDDKGKKQNDINAETDVALEDRYTKEQTYSKSELNNMITTPNQKYVTVTATNQTTDVTDVLPATGESDTVYRIGNWDGSQFDASVYSEYSWSGSSYVHLSTKTKIGEVFDISAYHATGGTLATYANLLAALDSNNGGGVPQSLRKGGMSIKFVQTSDNKYVQYRLMSDIFNTTPANWQGIDNEPTAGSNNLVKSGGVASSITKEHTNAIRYTLTQRRGFTYDLTRQEEEYYSAYVLTSYIPIKNGDVVLLKYAVVNHGKIILFDSDKNYLSYYTFNDPRLSRTITISTSNVAFIIVNYLYEERNSISIEINNGGAIEMRDIPLYTNELEKNIAPEIIIVANGTLGNYYNSYGVRTSYAATNGCKYVFIETNRPNLEGYKYKLSWAGSDNANAIGKVWSNGEARSIITGSGQLADISDYADRVKCIATNIEEVSIEDETVVNTLRSTDFEGYYVKIWTSNNIEAFYSLLSREVHDVKLFSAEKGLGTPVDKFLGFVQGKYVTTDSNNKKIISTNNNLSYLKLDIDVVLDNIIIHNFKFSPSKGSEQTYFHVVFFDSNGSLLKRYETLNHNDSVIIYKNEIEDSVEGYISLPTLHKSELRVSYNSKISDDKEFVVSDSYNFVQGKYVTDVNGQKIIASNNSISYVPIELKRIISNIKIGNFTFSPSNGDVNTYLRVTFFDSSGTLTQSYNKLTDSSSLIISKADIPDDSVEGFISIPTVHKDELWVEYNTDSEVIDTKNIITQQKEVSERILLQYKKAIRQLNGDARSETPLVLLHFSDIHGGAYNLQRIMEYYNHFAGYIDDILCTGDVLPMEWTHDFTYWHDSGADNVLNIIGNHDTAYYTEQEGFDWTRYAGKQAYDRYLAPFIAQWNVIQPNDAESVGKCYWYKDYGTNIRLIAIDDMSLQKDGDAVQMAWLDSVLNDALVNNKHIIMTAHYSCEYEAIGCPFECIGADERAHTYEQRATIINKIDTFITNGGNFIAWLTGHVHRDSLGIVKNTVNKQLMIAVSTAMYQTQSIFDNINRVVDTPSADLFNIVKIDSYNKRISLFRVGSDFDSDGRHIGTVTLDYENCILLDQY